MRLWPFAFILGFTGLVSLSQTGFQAARPVQVTLESGQQLFPSVTPDLKIAYSQRNGADWDVYVMRPPLLPST